jgi:hypothetical protein
MRREDQPEGDAVELVTEEIEVEPEAEYALERPVKCPTCSATLQNFNVVRMLRTKVNFTSNLPRRGYAILCPECGAVFSAHIASRVL